MQVCTADTGTKQIKMLSSPRQRAPILLKLESTAHDIPRCSLQKQRKRKALSTATSENSNMTTSLRLQLLLGTQITANRFSCYLESAPVTAADPTLTPPWTSLRTFHLGPLRYGLEVGSGRCNLLLGVLARLHVDVWRFEALEQ